jgi:hypothetical protein
MSKFIRSPRVVIVQETNGDYSVMCVSKDSGEVRKVQNELAASKEFLGVWTYAVPTKRALQHQKIAEFEAPKQEVQEEAPKKRGRKPKQQD